MNVSKMLSRAGRTGAVSILALAGAAIAVPASAQTANPLNSIVGCDAAGNQQRNGALLGGVLGAAAGAAVAKKDGQGAVIGGLLGAAAGSYLGCQQQRQAQAQPQPYDQGYAYEDRGYNYDRTYDRGYYEPAYGTDVRLARGVQRVSFTPSHEQVTATAKVNIRSGPSTSAARVGQLYAGEAVEALGYVRGSDWVLVGRNGVGIGYVARAYVRTASYDRYAQGYSRY